MPFVDAIMMTTTYENVWGEVEVCPLIIIREKTEKKISAILHKKLHVSFSNNCMKSCWANFSWITGIVIYYSSLVNISACISHMGLNWDIFGLNVIRRLSKLEMSSQTI